MRRAGTITRVLPVALSAALLAGIPAAATAAAPTGTTAKQIRAIPTPPRSGGKPAYEARLVLCTRSPQTQRRMAFVATQMRPVPGARRLTLRIDLYQRPLGGGRWALRSDVPGLGEWVTPSDPSIGSRSSDVFRYRQAVGRLVVPFAFRFTVTFRWLDATGKPVNEAVVVTQPCREPDVRPDLVVTRATAETVVPDQGMARYVVTVKNVGRSHASGVQLAATFPSPMRTIRKLAPRESADLTFWGPAPCTEGTVPPSFLADPANTIDEANETNNSLAVTCPATLDGP